MHEFRQPRGMTQTSKRHRGRDGPWSVIFP
jgi:hypothetical protein